MQLILKSHGTSGTRTHTPPYSDDDQFSRLGRYQFRFTVPYSFMFGLDTNIRCERDSNPRSYRHTCFRNKALMTTWVSHLRKYSIYHRVLDFTYLDNFSTNCSNVPLNTTLPFAVTSTWVGIGINLDFAGI